MEREETRKEEEETLDSFFSLPRNEKTVGGFERSDSRDDVTMAAIAFLIFFSTAMFPPLLPSLAREFAVGPMDFKWLVPGFSIAYGTTTLAYGVLSDRFGRAVILKRLLIFAAGAMAILSCAATAKQLMLFRTLSGFATGGIVTISLSIIGDRYPYVIQGRPMGKMFGAIAAGIGLGASVGPMISSLVGWRFTIRLVGAGLFLTSYFVHRRYQTPTADTPKQRLSLLILDEYRCILAAARGHKTLAFILANGIFHGGIFAWLGVLLAERFRLGETALCLTFIGYGVPDLILGALIGGWADRYGRRYVVPGGFFWAAACAGLIAVSSTPWMAALFIAALSIGFDATHPLMSSITTSIDPKHRGQVTGMTTFANFLGMAIGALIFGNLLRFGSVPALLYFSGIEAIVGIAALVCFQAEKPIAKPEQRSTKLST